MFGDDDSRVKSVLMVAGGVFILALILLFWLGGYGFIGAFFLALLIGLIVAVILWFGFGGSMPTGTAGQGETPNSARDSATADPAPEPAPAPQPMAEPEPAPAPVAEPEPTAAASSSMGQDYDGDGILEGKNEGTKPATLAGPRGGVADDLKQIKGVGPKLEKTCNELGFYHFDQIAALTADEVAWVDANLVGFPGRVSRDNWVEQARVLAAGDATEFSKRVEDGDVY